MKHLTSILIIEPSDIIVEGLRTILEEAGGFNILASLCDSTNLNERIIASQPDVLIINPTLLPQPVRSFLASLQQTRPQLSIISLIYQYVEPDLLQAFKSTIDIRENRSTIISIINESFASTCDETDMDGNENADLSDRELDVLVLVAKGYSSKAIADELHISIHTVNSHRKNITHKTGIKSVAGLAVYAMLHNLM
ncbi:MAG: response regulator transcription factor [Bacteroidales bacterium]|nr:response regulator transcription factor [Bacteroidales bacterium]